MLRSLALTLAMLSATAMAQALPQPEPQPQQETPPPQAETAPPPESPASPAEPAPAEVPMAPEPATPAASPLSPQAAAASSAQAEQKRFEQFRRDLVSLLALRADADLLVAAAELAYADSDDKSRPAALKSPSLIKRAQKFGPDIPFVWWVSTFLECGTKGTSCHGDAATRLEQLDGNNAAAWLPALYAANAPGQSRAVLTSMAQATRFDDFSAAGVLAVYRALQTLPVPDEVLSHGLNATAARVNLATTVGGAFMPNFARLGEMCRKQDDIDEALVADCLAVAHLFESGGTYRSQSVGFSIDDSLLPAGTARDVLRARMRASAWQRQQFLEVSGRFARDEALVQVYVDLLHENGNELATVTALLRNQHLSTEPPAGWQPQQANPNAVARDPNVIPPAH